MKYRNLTIRSLALAGLALCSTARADMVTEWNANAVKAVQRELSAAPPVEARALAIVQAAVYDAVNGIVQEYEPYFVAEQAPPGARPEAAAAQAAYTVLVAILPDQKTNF